MHGNNEHCLAAVRVFPDSIHLKGEHGNLQSSLCLPRDPTEPALTSTKAHGGTVFNKLQFPAPSPPQLGAARPPGRGPRGGHQPASIKLFSTSTAEQFLGLLCWRSSNETHG